MELYLFHFKKVTSRDFSKLSPLNIKKKNIHEFDIRKQNKIKTIAK